MLVTLKQLKKHLNIDESFTDDDKYIAMLGEVATQSVMRELDMTKDELMGYGPVPAPITHAMMLLAGSLYANREAVSYSSAVEVPLAYQYLLSPYKKHSF